MYGASQAPPHVSSISVGPNMFTSSFRLEVSLWSISTCWKPMSRRRQRLAYLCHASLERPLASVKTTGHTSLIIFKCFKFWKIFRSSTILGYCEYVSSRTLPLRNVGAHNDQSYVLSLCIRHFISRSFPGSVWHIIMIVYCEGACPSFFFF